MGLGCSTCLSVVCVIGSNNTSPSFPFTKEGVPENDISITVVLWSQTERAESYLANRQ